MEPSSRKDSSVSFIKSIIRARVVEGEDRNPFVYHEKRDLERKVSHIDYPFSLHMSEHLKRVLLSLSSH